MNPLFLKAFVEPFYQAFFGFFLLVFLVAGLLMEFPQHVMLGQRILENPLAFAFLLLLFLIYGWLQFRFQVQLHQKLAYRVFHQMALYKPTDFFKIQSRIWLYNHLLLLVYAVFLCFLSVISGYWFQPLLLWLLLAGMYFIHKYLLLSKLSQALPDQKSTFWKKQGFKPYAIHRGYWLIVHLKENRLLLLLASKAIVLILLNLFFFSYATGDYDERWLQFGVLCAAFVNAPVWKEKKEFEQKKLTYFLNLPQPSVRKAWLHLYSTLQVISLEIIFLMIHHNSFPSVGTTFSLVVLLISLNLGIYALINLTKEDLSLSRNSVVAFFSLFFLIIFGFPATLISALGIAGFVRSVLSAYRN